MRAVDYVSPRFGVCASGCPARSTRSSSTRWPPDGRRHRSGQDPARESGACLGVRELAGRLRAGVHILRDRAHGAGAQPRGLGDRRASAHRAARSCRWVARARRRVPRHGRTAVQLARGQAGGAGALRAVRPGDRRAQHHHLDRGFAYGIVHSPRRSPTCAWRCPSAARVPGCAVAHPHRRRSPARKGARCGGRAHPRDRHRSALRVHPARWKKRYAETPRAGGIGQRFTERTKKAAALGDPVQLDRGRRSVHAGRHAWQERFREP